MRIEMMALADALEHLADTPSVCLSDIAFIEQYTDKSDGLILMAYDRVWHFFNDADIRSREPGYDERQRTQLRRLATTIREREEEEGKGHP